MAVFRVEKTKDFTVMSNHHLRNVKLSLKAKGLLSLMLSLPEDWDYTTRGLAHICKDGVDSIASTLKELERHGYLTRQRFRYEKKINKSKTDVSNTYQSIYPAASEKNERSAGMDRMDLVDAYSEIIKENIEYDILIGRYGQERMDEVVDLILEVVLSKRPYIRIAGDDFPREVVKSRFLKINSGHLEYVFDSIDRNTTKVGNIKAYLMATLYNAPVTMDSYYRVEVNHDLYGN